MTNRYHISKIYKLVNDIDDEIYVGSTVQALSKRKGNHVSLAKSKNTVVYSHLNAIGWDNVRIVLIEEIKCENNEQLLMKEQHYMDLLKPSLNTRYARAICLHGIKKSRCKKCKG